MSSSNWTMVGIRKDRLNGLKLWTQRDNALSAKMGLTQRTPGNKLDAILQGAGVPTLTNKELEKEIAKLAKGQHKATAEVTAS